MSIRKRILKMASEKGPIWDGIEQEGFYDAKKEESAKLFCQQNPNYSYKQYNSKSKGMIFRIAPPEYFAQFEQNLKQPQYEDPTANQIQNAFNAMGEGAQQGGKEKMEQDMANQGYVDYRKPYAAQLHQEKYPEHKMQTITDENGNTVYRFTTASKNYRLEKRMLRTANGDILNQVKEYAEQRGLTDEEIKQITDSRFYQYNVRQQKIETIKRVIDIKKDTLSQGNHIDLILDYEVWDSLIEQIVQLYNSGFDLNYIDEIVWSTTDSSAERVDEETIQVLIDAVSTGDYSATEIEQIFVEPWLSLTWGAFSTKCKLFPEQCQINNVDFFTKEDKKPPLQKTKSLPNYPPSAGTSELPIWK